MQRLIALTAVSAVLLVAGDGVRSQDTALPEPSTKLLFDNSRITVIEARIRPGDVGVLQQRPPRVVYFFNAGRLKYTDFDGKSEVRSYKAGEAVWKDQDEVETENIGQTEVRELIIVPK